MEKRNSDLDGLYKELPGRFGALSGLFGELSSPAAVKELLDSLTLADAAKPFPRLVDRRSLSNMSKNLHRLCRRMPGPRQSNTK